MIYNFFNPWIFVITILLQNLQIEFNNKNYQNFNTNKYVSLAKIKLRNPLTFCKCLKNYIHPKN